MPAGHQARAMRAGFGLRPRPFFLSLEKLNRRCRSKKLMTATKRKQFHVVIIDKVPHLSLLSAAQRGPVVKIVTCGCPLHDAFSHDWYTSELKLQVRDTFVFWAAELAAVIQLLQERPQISDCGRPVPRTHNQFIVYAWARDLAAVRPLVPSGVELRATDVDFRDQYWWMQAPPLQSEATGQLLSLCGCDPDQTVREIFVARYTAMLRANVQRLSKLRSMRGIKRCYTFVSKFNHREVWDPSDFELTTAAKGVWQFNQVIDCFVRLLCLWAVRALEQATGRECGRDVKRLLCALVLD